MSGPPMLRAAGAADVPAMVAIYGHHVRQGTATFEIEPPGQEEMTRRLDAGDRDGLPWLVAEAADRVVGYAYAGPYRPRPAYRHTVEDSIYLAPEAMGQGLGRALLTALIAACAARGDRQMVAVIGDSGNAASIGLHAALGFAHVGTLRDVGRKFDRWLDVVLMQRALGDGGASAPLQR